MRLVATFVVLAAAVADPVAAQSPTCTQLAQQIEQEQIAMTLATSATDWDDSVLRHTLAQLKISNSWSAIQVAMTLMQTSRCTPINHPISASAYRKPLAACLKAKATADEESACNQANWKPDYSQR